MMEIHKNGVDSRIAGGRLTISLDALVANYGVLRDRSGAAKCAAVVKANAYGLGAKQVVKALWNAGCDTFFVAMPDEGFVIKRLFPNATIYVLNGIHEESVANVAEGGLVPVLGSLKQIELWADYWERHGSRRPCAIQVDTGMNRIGLSVEEAIAFRKRNMKEHIVTPMLIMTHLACADEPNHPLNAAQLDSFQIVAKAFDDIDSSLCNSAGLYMGPDYLFDVTRPGIALYGGEAVNGSPTALRPVVKLEARIAQVRHVKKSETVSYGATHKLEHDAKIATVSVGYADGYPRAGSSAGVALRQALPTGAHGFIGGKNVPLIGRMTMDLCMFDVTEVSDEHLSNGWIELIGDNILIDEAARAAGTIGYELLTSLGQRYERRYISGEI
ncbi:MAG: alanine racemase [Pseudomonadota bacterium]